MKYVAIVLFMLAFLITSAISQIPTNGLVAYYPFNNDTANDASGNGNNGTNFGATPATDRFGKANSCYHFNGDAFIRAKDTTLLDLTYSFTFSLWVKLDTTSTFPATTGLQLLVGKWTNSAADQAYVFEIADPSHARITIMTDPSSTVFSHHAQTDFAIHNWHHLVVTYDSSTIRHYVDGSLDTTIAQTGHIHDGPGALTIGAHDANVVPRRWLFGSLDDIRIYNRALDSTEIQALYHETDLVAYYPFTNGSTADSSGNGHDGTSNGALPTTDRFGGANSAFSFDGASNISVLNSPSLLPDSGSYSICGWFRISSIDQTKTETAILDMEDQTSGDYSGNLFEFDNTERRARFYFHHDDSWTHQTLLTSSSILEIDQWYFYAATLDRDDSLAHLYLNGQIVAIEQADPQSITSSMPLLIGERNNNPPYQAKFSGKQDDIRIYNRALSPTDIKNLYGRYRQSIASISDIPADQGGKVRITWDKIYLDSSSATPQITSYRVWRKIPAGAIPMRMVPETMVIANDTLATQYDYLGTVNALQSLRYNIVAHTLSDSSDGDSHDETYIISAHTSDPNVYYLSMAMEGHSVDNLAPAPPSALVATVQSGPSVDLSWSPLATERDFDHYVVHRSSVQNFTPSPSSTIIGNTGGTTLTDNSIVGGNRYYYKVVAVDEDGNQSAASPQANAGVKSTLSVDVASGWNLVSVPLDVDDFTKATLYPTAVSSAFAYNSSYVIEDPLSNGKGYWVKFPGVKNVPIDGYMLTSQSIPVVAGWNLIGSLTQSMDVSLISSNPPGLVTSPFYGYSGSYTTSTSLEPGKGYWVKSIDAGTLLLSSVSNDPASRISITETSELPPPPPGVVENLTSSIPQDFALGQNFPNPFNPSTSITYGLPSASRVKLEIFDMLDQRVSTLVDGQVEPGYYSVNWDASAIASGLYFYRMDATDLADPSRSFSQVKKLMLVR